MNLPIEKKYTAITHGLYGGGIVNEYSIIIWMNFGDKYLISYENGITSVLSKNDILKLGIKI